MAIRDTLKWAECPAHLSRTGSVAALSVGLFWSPKGRRRGPIRPRPQQANVSRLDMGTSRPQRQRPPGSIHRNDALSQHLTPPQTGAVPEPIGSRFSERHPGGASLRSSARRLGFSEKSGWLGWRLDWRFSESAATRDPCARRFGRKWPPRAAAAAHSGAARHCGRGLPGCGVRPRPRAFSGPNRQSESICALTREAMTEYLRRGSCGAMAE